MWISLKHFSTLIEMLHSATQVAIWHAFETQSILELGHLGPHMVYNLRTESGRMQHGRGSQGLSYLCTAHVLENFASMNFNVLRWMLRYSHSATKCQKSRCAILFNALKPGGNYTSHLLQQLVSLHFVFICFVWFSVSTAIISLNSINQLIFVMVKIVFFAVRTELLNII
jgi:hypothetical protein